ncbi:MAG: hydrogenobyrinic acid a,c-diamide synthase (glutamine-hydrolyzing), partial [Methanomassiliicoccaceae archaeon]|nr:hydrogenobyrinic acid a,c-diamide synthase (glutamine-hydrolyzing) [Methanomassiliicoccaceae archaeon]
MKGVVISGTGSGTGKTAIATGLMSRLSARYNVQGYKVGPDFIDPMYHTAATGRPSRNLDSFMMSPGTIKNLVGYSSKDADICIVEGVRGLFEGSSGTDDAGSTAEIAKMLDLPVILVVNARSLTRSAAAIVNGFMSFDKDLRIAGVIMNNVSNEQHQRKLTDAMNRYSDVKVLGMVRRDISNAVNGTAKGLAGPKDEYIQKMNNMTCGLDLDIIIDAMSDVPDMPSSPPYAERCRQGMKAAVAIDGAFCFYYRENLECMISSGIDVTTFRPADGDMLPDADIYYLGGGYPEMHAGRLSGNMDFMEGIKNASDEGKAIIGESGGMLALCDSITISGQRYKMSGVLTAEAEITGERHGPSYVIAHGSADNPFFSGITSRAHE